jgi:hypothetical protein
LLPRLYLHHRLRHKFVHLGAKLRLGDQNALGVEVAGHLADDAVAAGLEIGGDHITGVGAGSIARDSEPLRHP